MNRSLKITITILIVLLVAGTIAYPKLKPFLASKLKKQQGVPGPGSGPGPGNFAGGRFGQQTLLATGYIIKPAQMSEIIKQVGTLKPDEEVDLSFETSGKIVRINFSEGTRVKKGDLLAKINDKPLQAQLEKLLAQRKLAEAKEFRQRSLLDRDAISKESYDQIVTELQTTQADINLVKARILETELRAPFDGVIGLRTLSEGAFVNTSTKIARLVKTSPIKIEFGISEKYAGEVKPGFPCTFTVEGSNTIYDATVYAVEPKTDIQMRSIMLRALYPNKDEELKTGRYATVYLKLSQIENAISIPTEALIPEMEGERVFVYRGGKAASVKVSTGLRTESAIQVTEGLKFGDTLLITGILQLRQGLPVQIDSVVTGN